MCNLWQCFERKILVLGVWRSGSMPGTPTDQKLVYTSINIFRTNAWFQDVEMLVGFCNLGQVQVDGITTHLRMRSRLDEEHILISGTGS